MSDSLREIILSTWVTALNTGAPIGVPALVRDRWFDIDAPATPALLLAGWEDDPRPSQEPDEPHFQRELKATFELWAKAASPLTASQAVDQMTQWIQKTLCGIPDSGSALAGKVIRVRLGKAAAITLKNDVCRAYVEVVAEYRVIVDDATT